jgi:hypothetical protein
MWGPGAAKWTSTEKLQSFVTAVFVSTRWSDGGQNIVLIRAEGQIPHIDLLDKQERIEPRHDGW